MKEKVFSDWYHQTRDITARAGFDAAWQHQQAKVEELQKRIDDSIFILSTIDNPNEAYKAIDFLLRALRGEQALKGEG